jgi:hypothetical protein
LDVIGLLRESWNEIVNRPLAMLQCFWLSIALYCLALVLLYAGVIAFLEMIIVLLVVVILAVTPGAVRWHRHVISCEKTTWIPRLPDVLSLAYAVKVLAATLALSIVQKFASSVIEDLAMPVYFLLRGPTAQPIGENSASGLALMISLFAFVLIFGSWMLHLPEGALDPSARGMRKRWPPSGLQSFLLALSVVYLAPEALFFAVPYFAPDYTVGAIVMSICVSVFCMSLGLSLLTVTYRKNMEYAGITFGHLKKS